MVNNQKVILQGGGDHARVVIDCLKSQNADILGIFDPRLSGSLFNVPQLGIYQPGFNPDALAIIAIGDNSVRKKVAERSSHRFTNAIHESAIISPYSSIGLGNMILHGAIIQANATIHNHVIVNTGAQIDHDCVIENYVHLAPGAILCGTVSIGEGSFIGAGAVIIPGKKIGKWAKIGAGAVVIEDVPDYAVAVGNPARVIRLNTHE